jgi:enamine deaminase RidA (YjgF/YER057c/UK114 family)
MSLPVANPSPTPVQVPAVNSGSLISFALPARPGEGVEGLCGRFAACLHERAATPLHLQVFGHCQAWPVFLEALRKRFGRVDWPITWVAGGACGGQPVAGLQVHAFTGKIERLVCDGTCVASVFTDGGARQCVVGGLLPDDRNLSQAEQTARTLEKLQIVLGKAGFELAEVVRTWFFLDRILAWYNDFNQVRTKIYSGVKFRSGSWPASTGVGASNPAGAALALAAWAFRPLGQGAYAEEVASPLQCPAPAYGSAFSRALETSTNTGRRLFISGTASIAPGGETRWVGDLRKQVELTFEVVEFILSSRGFAFTDLTCATAYLRRPIEADAFAEWLAANRWSHLPVISAQCDVCRDDLRFELEAEAMSAR